jgi:hypothetical protein
MYTTIIILNIPTFYPDNEIIIFVCIWESTIISLYGFNILFYVTEF